MDISGEDRQVRFLRLRLIASKPNRNKAFWRALCERLSGWFNSNRGFQTNVGPEGGRESLTKLRTHRGPNIL